MKNGKVDERAQFATIQALFTRLTSRHFDVVQAADSTHAERIQVIPVETFPGHLDRPEVNIRRFGAGAIEGLYLATILGSPNRVAMLDEPGVHLSPTGQRRLLAALRAHAGERQLVIITHNSDLVPVATEGDLRSVVRLTAAPDAVTVHRSAVDALASSGLQRLIGTAEMRDLLFAAGVVFCEGETDLVLLREWFDSRLELRRGTPRTTHYDTMASDELPTTVEANVAILGVGGEQQLRQAAQFVRSFGIPWAMVVDAPALSPSSKLAGWLTANDLLPALDEDVDFATAKSAFAAAGVFTLANHFIDGPGDKSGEIEWFMRELNPQGYVEAAKLSPGRGKQAGKGIAVARAFASAVPAPPVVVDLWIDLLNHLSAPASAVSPD